MHPPLIVGVSHEAGGSKALLDRECREGFVEHVLPLIDRDTLILLEGDFQKSYHKRWHPLYHWRLRTARRFVGAPINRPTIGWRDARFIDRSRVAEVYALFDLVEMYVTPHISLLSPPPADFLDLERQFLNSAIAYELVNPPHERGLMDRCCLEMLHMNIRFDTMMIASAKAWMESGRRAIIICGLGHLYTLRRSTNWPTKYLSNGTSADAQDVAMSLVAYTLHPEQLLKDASRRL